MNSQQRFHATVYGRVQGVSFRAYTQARGRSLGLTGYARNKIDGSVEVIAEGSRPQLEALLAFLDAGSPAARVDRVEVLWGEATGRYDDFAIA